MKKNILKLVRFIKIYGISRTFIKLIAQKRFNLSLPNIKKERDISFIGCGQFPFATTAYFLYFNNYNRFLGCFDINKEKSDSLANFYKFKKSYNSSEELFQDENCKLIYIASNHATHTSYAINALKRNIDVYIEKPISTSFEQFKNLLIALETSNGKIYAGYNRPFSKAISLLSQKVDKFKLPISLSCFISGHQIPIDHWYRNEEEGTRICGNLGHWIDLAVHLMLKTGLNKNKFNINIVNADIREPSDNVCITISTERHDLITLFLTSRSEPFEGVTESINFQCGDIISKIDDFRNMTIWSNEKIIKKSYFPKDVGHKAAILQPFSKNKRDFDEVKISTLLMLHINDMVTNQISFKNINIDMELKNIIK